jgi:hypothetical protein
MCKEDVEMVIAYFNALLRHMPGVTKENRELQRHAIHPTNQESNPVLTEYKTEVMIFQPLIILFFDREHV